MFTGINQVFLYLLTTFSQFFGGNFGLAIISLTVLIRLALLPIILPSLKSQKKIQDLKPDLDKLKKKYGHDKQELSKRQLELYKQHKVNPVAGCLPQLVQLFLFIAFYQVLIASLKDTSIPETSLEFLWLTLNQPDQLFILPVATALFQFLLGLMLVPGADTSAEKVLAAQTKTKKDDKEADDATAMAQAMQSQMLYFMPLFTGFIATRFPSGLALYWVTSTLFSLVQQYFISGLGGLTSRLTQFGLIKSTK